MKSAEIVDKSEEVSTVLEEAYDIVVARKDNTHNDYGEFTESMARAKIT